MNLIITDGNDSRFTDLCCELDKFLNEAVGVEKQNDQYNKFNKVNDIHDVVIALVNNEPVGCGSFKIYDYKTAEIKRVFVKESFRHKGIGKIIMEKLEHHAIEKGFTRLILETGKPLKGAQNMYKRLGFKIIENYGQYKDIVTSICMEKKIQREL